MPTVSSVHVSVPLSNVAIKYKNPAFVAELIAPVVPVNKESDKYYIFGKEELRDKDSLRAAGAEANEIEWDVTTATYSAEEYALKYMLPDRIRDNADVAVQPRINTTEKLTKWIRLGYEKRVQAIAQNIANVGGSATPGTTWDAASGQDPEEDVDIAKTSIRQTAGVNPNTMLMSEKVWQALRRWLKSQSTNLTYQEYITLGKPPDTIWNLKLIVAGSIENTANEGQADNIADIWNDNVLVAYIEQAPSLDSLSFMYTFRSRVFRTKTWREEKRDGEFIECSVIQDEKLIASDAAYLITDVLT
jgi:hypothetical protein